MATSDGAARDPARATNFFGSARRYQRGSLHRPGCAEDLRFSRNSINGRRTQGRRGLCAVPRIHGIQLRERFKPREHRTRKAPSESTLLAVAEGRFDRKNIAAYASQTGTREARGGKEIFSVPMARGTRRITFTFLRSDRIALTNDASLESTLFSPMQTGHARLARTIPPARRLARIRRGAARCRRRSSAKRASARRPAIAPTLGSDRPASVDHRRWKARS